MNSFRTLALAALLFFGGAVAPASAQTIVDIATGDPQFSSLVDAVVAEDLAETLSSTGPFTVFAPTNDAFADLPAYVGTALENNPELLSEILLYHVVPGELFAADVLEKNRLETAQGEKLRVNMRSGDPHVDSSQIIATDVDATNGVVHVVDQVLIPNSVYNAVIDDLREQVRALVDTMRDVRHDRIEKRG